MIGFSWWISLPAIFLWLFLYGCSDLVTTPMLPSIIAFSLPLVVWYRLNLTTSCMVISHCRWGNPVHCSDVIMTTIASQITSLTIVYSIVYSGADQNKHQSSASLVFVCRIHRGSVNCPHKWPVTRKMFPFDDVIMRTKCINHIMQLMRIIWRNKQSRGHIYGLDFISL